MATEYHPADEEVYNLMNQVLRGYFPELDTLEPRPVIDIRMAVSDKGEPAVKHHGHAAAATIELIKPKEKSKSGLDLRIVIDKAMWLDMDEEEQIALLHHELRHPEPQYEKDGRTPRIDAYGRPKLKLRLDDWMLTGFRECVRIFGEKSRERQSLRRVEAMLGQMDLPFISAKPDRPAASAGLAGVESIEMSGSDGVSVTLSGKEFDAVAKAGKALRKKTVAE